MCANILGIAGVVLYMQGFGAALGCGGADVDQGRLGQLPLLRWAAQGVGGQGKWACCGRKLPID